MYMAKFENYIKQIKKKVKLNSNININNNHKYYHNIIINTFKLGFFEFDNTNIINYSHTEQIYGKSFNSIPILIRKTIIKNKQYNNTFKFNINNRSFQINFITNKKTNIDKNTIKMVYIILFLCDNFSNSDYCSNNLIIYIYLTNHKKTLPDGYNNISLDRAHINTAFTYSCVKDNYIYIFREEEWFKCFIHECLHAFGFDFAQTFSRENDIYASKIIQKIFPLNFDLNLNESYTELFSIYLNCVLKAFFSTYNKNSNKFNSKVINKAFLLLNDELYFSLFQCSKIFDHYNINYDLLHNNNKSVLNKYDEDTPVFSYFVIKTILLYNFNEFFTWAIKHNKNIIHFDCNNINNYVKSKSKTNKCFTKIKSYCQLIIKNYKKREFINDMNKIHQIFIQTKSKTFIHKSLRFTIYG